MPFVEGRAAYAHEPGATESTEVPRIRTDELRKAFNTPFWPYVLATTSVGQEGLDFHAWCPAPHDFFGQPSARRRMSYVQGKTARG